MSEKIYKVLFLCTGNSARSILAEAILNKIGGGKFRAYSAGSQPKGQVNSNTLQLLERLGYDFFHNVVDVNLVYNDDSGKRLENGG